MRGKSELKSETNSAQQTSSGLDRNYITQWSYGIGETFSLMIPNIKGGASVPIAQNEKKWKRLINVWQHLLTATQYFGDQPMTAGPVYVGAFCCAPIYSGTIYR